MITFYHVFYHVYRATRVTRTGMNVKSAHLVYIGESV